MDLFIHIIKKFISLLLTLFVVATITFFLMKAIPGDPFQQEQAIPKEIMDALFAHYGLDKPLHIQYIEYLKGICHFDLGPSLKYEGRTATGIIKDSFPISLTLGLIALIVSIFSGLLIGVSAALNKGKWQDKTCTIITVLYTSIPSFILASLLQYCFAIKFHILPIARLGSWEHFILPILALSAFPTAFIARLVRSNVLETLEKNYILTAKAKGLKTFYIIRKYILKNSILPVFSYISTLLASILTGSFVIEKIFGIPGLGSWFVSSITNRDYSIIMGLTLFFSFIVIFAIFITDLLYLWIDPRIKNSSRKVSY